jgi:hypothetical protein
MTRYVFDASGVWIPSKTSRGVRVKYFGGGGGGADAQVVGFDAIGGGGGGGGAAGSALLSVTKGFPVQFIIGAGGAANGGTAGDTVVQTGKDLTLRRFLAKGGGGGQCLPDNPAAEGGRGGQAALSIGPKVYSGGPGGGTVREPVLGAGGGGGQSAWVGGDGFDGGFALPPYGGTGYLADEEQGGGGAGASTPTHDAQPPAEAGKVPGGGGGGGAVRLYLSSSCIDFSATLSGGTIIGAFRQYVFQVVVSDWHSLVSVEDPDQFLAATAGLPRTPPYDPLESSVLTFDIGFGGDNSIYVNATILRFFTITCYGQLTFTDTFGYEGTPSTWSVTVVG